MATWRAFVDGGSRGHAGPAGVGVVLEAPAGERVEISEALRPGCNNYAEYAALLVALGCAAESGCRRLHVFSDSEVVVRQISGHYSCQSPALRPLYELCVALIAGLEHFAITHIPRTRNAEANRLAQAAIAERQRRKRRRTRSSRFDAAVESASRRLRETELADAAEGALTAPLA